MQSLGLSIKNFRFAIVSLRGICILWRWATINVFIRSMLGPSGCCCWSQRFNWRIFIILLAGIICIALVLNLFILTFLQHDQSILLVPQNNSRIIDNCSICKSLKRLSWSLPLYFDFINLFLVRWCWLRMLWISILL